MYIKALSKRMFINSLKEKGVNDDTVEQFKTTYFISVNDPADENSHYFKKEHPNVLTLYFHDAIDDGSYAHYLHGYNNETQEPIYRPMIFFSGEMAKTVVNFLEEAQKNVCQSLIVHCTAGISRSGAIVTFARDFFDDPCYNVFEMENPQILPNHTVLSRLTKEHTKRLK